jgi:superfamily II DNA or RNA helicase
VRIDATTVQSLVEFVTYLRDTPTGARGERYAMQGKVLRLESDDDTAITAHVAGTRRLPYAASLEDGPDWLLTSCTCPVGADCKHTYALALTILGAAFHRRVPWAQDFGWLLPAPWTHAGEPKPLQALEEDIDRTLPDLGGGARTKDRPWPPEEMWWQSYLAVETRVDRREIVGQAALDRIESRVPWYFMDRLLAALREVQNPIQVLRSFDSALESVARRDNVRLRPRDPRLEAYAESKEAEALYVRFERAIAHGALMSWLTPRREARTAERGRIELVWLAHPVADGPSELGFQLLLTAKKLRRRPRHQQAIEQLVRDIDSGKRQFPPDEARLVRWVARQPTAPFDTYDRSQEARSTLSVHEPLTWLSRWGGEGGITWRDGGTVSLAPEPARLTVAPDSAGELAWMVRFPVEDSSAPDLRPLCEVPIVVVRPSAHESQDTETETFIREGDVLRRLETGGMPWGLISHIVTVPEVPVDLLRGTPEGTALAYRLAGGGTALAEVPFVDTVPARPVLEWRLEGASTVSVVVRAEAEGGVAFCRTHEGVWEIVDDLVAQPASDTQALAEDEDRETPSAGEPAVTQTEGGITLVPDPDAVGPAEAWLEQVIPGSAVRGTTNFGVAQFTWNLRKGDRLGLLLQWQERPRGVTYQGNAAFRDFVTTRRVPQFKMSVAPSGVDWLQVSIEMEKEMAAVSLEEVEAALQQSEDRLVVLPGGYVYQRDDLEEYREHLDALNSLGLDPAEGDQRVHALQLGGNSGQKLMELADADERLRELAEHTRGLVESFEGIPAAPVADAIASTLRPYQQAGVDFLAWTAQTFGGALLADDMGLGKTFQVLAVLDTLKAGTEEHRPSLVVCPASVAHNWQREAQHFTPGLRVLVLESGKARKKLLETLDEYDIVVKNYALTRRDVDALRKYQWRMVCVDEAQAIKNPAAEITKAVKSLEADFRVALTGTPIENRLTDLWSIMDFAVPGYLGPLDAFEHRAKAQNPARLYDVLRARLRPLLLRRLKREVATELPPRIEERRDCEMPTGQRKAYLAELKKTRMLLKGIESEKVVGKSRIQILASLTRLRQLCCEPALVGIDGAGSGKVDELLGLVASLLEGGNKILLFSQFVRMLNRLKPILEAKGIPTYTLTGRTKKRQDLVDAFEADTAPSVFLISLKAGGTGLNLVSASHVILFDPWWNPAVEAQAIDRTHRIGQDKTVVAFRLVTLGTIEERIMELQERKRALVENVLEEDGFNRSLTREDFEYLLSADGER